MGISPALAHHRLAGLRPKEISMDADRTGWVPLPDIGDTYRAERAGVHRDSIGRARRVSNWTAAALIVSTGAAGR